VYTVSHAHVPTLLPVWRGPPPRRLAPRCPTHQWWRVGVGTLTDVSLKFLFLVMRFRPEVIVDLRADGQRVAYEALRECR
jgi:hypothetical protein